MQLISPGLPLAAASAMPLHPRFVEFFQREEVRHLVTFVLIVLVQFKRYLQFRNEVLARSK